jgi:hypothetical protein
VSFLAHCSAHFDYEAAKAAFTFQNTLTFIPSLHFFTDKSLLIAYKRNTNLTTLSSILFSIRTSFPFSHRPIPSAYTNAGKTGIDWQLSHLHDNHQNDIFTHHFISLERFFQLPVSTRPVQQLPSFI